MLYAIVAVLAIIVDQVVKYWVAGNIALNTGVKELIPGVLSLVNLHNEGAAFGFMAGGNARIYFIIACGVFTVLIILGLATNFISTKIGRWSAVLVAAGGLGNCIDRVMSGYVQDMFKLDFMNFAIFNVADIFITVGCFVFILDLLFGGKKAVDDEYDEFYEDEDDEDDQYVTEDEEPRPDFTRGKAAGKAAVERVKKEKEKNSRKARQAKYEDEYEQYKAARAAKQQEQGGYNPEPIVRQNAPQPKTPDSGNPFAEWERANAAVRAEQQRRAGEKVLPDTPVVQEAPRRSEATPPETKSAGQSKPASYDEFDLDDILAEFR